MPFINEVLEHNQRMGGTAPPMRQSRFQFDLDKVMQLLRSRITGQGAALDAIAASLALTKAELGDPRKPLAVMLLMGPTGVGKTETVRLLAEAIHGRADALCRIDMNTLAQEHYAASLTGAPPGYVGSKEGNTLFDREAIEGSFGKPGIVLFDELEKASEPVIRALMNIFDNGQLRLSSGTSTLDFRNSLIFMTSNVGAQALWAWQQRQQQGWRRWLPESWRVRQEQKQQQQALEKAFAPEFLNRIDQQLSYQRLGDEQVILLVELALERLNNRLARHQVQLLAEPALKTWLGEQGFDRRYGARAMARSFRQHLEPEVARVLLETPDRPAGCLLLADLDAQQTIRLTLKGPND
ncbi:MAG: AAA family ATPase [Pseudoalteromonas distincta]|jgi:ATP-dependent Clp protease ATP-binding subunit ClpA|tara:strand:+ start:1127 stop:2185 length:1059 start_codon:yes stop_codon:yes gene_type:complete